MASARRPLIALVGPTASGKTALAVRLAQAIEGEIVPADSRQIYRRLDVGTAKPSPEELAAVHHHLIDVVEPDQPLTLVEYQALAYQAIDDIHHRGKVPYLVGGTGLYVRAVLEGLQIPAAPPDPALRAALLAKDPLELHQELQAEDPESAARIHPHNVRRIIRALEVMRATGRPFSQQRRRRPPPYDVLMLGLKMDRATLYQRIDARIERMVEAGLFEEVRGLLEAGLSPELPGLTGLGYRQAVDHFQGRLSREEAIQAIKRDTRRFVRHQANWFRPDDPRIHWLDAANDPFPAALALVRAHLSSGVGS